MLKPCQKNTGWSLVAPIEILSRVFAEFIKKRLKWTFKAPLFNRYSLKVKRLSFNTYQDKGYRKIFDLRRFFS